MNFASDITCPKCSHQFSLSDEFQKNMETEKKQVQEEAEKSAKEKYDKNLEKEKMHLWRKAQKIAQEKSEEKFSLQMKDLENQNAENQKKLEISQQKELDFLKKERDLDEKSQNLELELEKKLSSELSEYKNKLEEKQKKRELELEKKRSEELNKVTEDLQKKFSEDHRLKLAEQEKKIDQMKKSLEEAQRRADQGSMQIQGDVKENDLRDMLSSEFLADIIEDVPTGVRGADIIQTVRNNLGQKSGVIIWESKNTKVWTEGWIQKLKDDQANLGADIAILVSKTLPEGVEQHQFRNGVWVVSYSFALSLVQLLRFHILEINSMKIGLQGKDEKMNMLYEYLSSPQFKNRIENIVDAFSTMKADLDTEKRSFQKQWSRREKQLERVMMNTSGFYGDLQGISGNAIQTVQSLELPE